MQQQNTELCQMFKNPDVAITHALSLNHHAPINRLINYRLSVNQTLPQHRMLTDPLYHCQDSVINRTEIAYTLRSHRLGAMMKPGVSGGDKAT